MEQLEVNGGAQEQPSPVNRLWDGRPSHPLSESYSRQEDMGKLESDGYLNDMQQDVL